MELAINKGIGKSAEFSGLTAQYLFIFAGGLLALFIVFVVMYLVGIGLWTCIIVSVVCALILIYGTFHLNKEYGQHGIMKKMAKSSHPRFIINRRSFIRLFIQKNKRK